MNTLNHLQKFATGFALASVLFSTELFAETITHNSFADSFQWHSAAGDDDKLNVLTKNVYGVWTSAKTTDRLYNIQSNSAKMEVFKPNGHMYDVVLIQEAFDTDIFTLIPFYGFWSPRAMFIAALQAYGYTLITDSAQYDGNLTDSGLLVFYNANSVSLNLINGQPYFFDSFDDLNGVDALGNKGFYYVQIQKGNRTYHLVNTHVQAVYEPHDTSDTADSDHLLGNHQEINAFYRAMRAELGNGRWIVGGDFNFDLHTNTQNKSPDDYLNALGAAKPVLSGHFTHTYTPRTNRWVDSGVKDEMLDYVTYFKDSQQPVQHISQIIKLNRDAQFSDHDAVYVHFEYPDQTAVADPIAVCAYQHSNYQGWERCFRASQANFVSTGINDAVSSLKVFNGATVEFYAHVNYQGQRFTYTQNTPWIGDTANDSFSSLRINSGSFL